MPPFPQIEGVRFAHIPGFPGYAASDDGRIWTCLLCRGQSGWREKRLTVNEQGYCKASFQLSGRQVTRKISRLILLAFKGEPPAPNYEAAHYPDRNPLNNKLSNLRWATRQENVDHQTEHGTTNAGVRNGRRKLTEHGVLEVYRLRAAGWKQKDISKTVGTTNTNVCLILNGHSWKHLHHHFRRLQNEKND